MTDEEIVKGLLNVDDKVSRQFFFENCRPLFSSIIGRVFPYHVDYNEFVSEFYVYLMDDNAARLKKFEGRSSIYQWLKTVALRFALELLRKRILIDTQSGIPPYTGDEPYDDEYRNDAKMDIETLLSRMTNKRQVYVLRRHFIDDIDEPTLAKELGVKVSNLYNIKKRAMTALSEVALTDIQQYGKKRE